MAIKSILLAYSGNAKDSGGLHLAIQMAKKYGAHLTAVVSHGATFMETEYSRYMSKGVLDILHARDSDVVAELRAQFEARVARALPPGTTSFLDLEARRGFTLTEASRTYDIVVMGRRASAPGREHFGIRPEQIAQDSGRPVILVPQDYSADTLNEHALVAWDGKRAATRALADAMHILETKALVTVLTVGNADLQSFQGDDITRLLERHGVKVDRVHRQGDARGVAPTILEVCRERDAGLLVMGAYEHSAFSEALFGGTTNDIMDDAHLPVLMSH